MKVTRRSWCWRKADPASKVLQVISLRMSSKCPAKCYINCVVKRCTTWPWGGEPRVPTTSRMILGARRPRFVIVFPSNFARDLIVSVIQRNDLFLKKRGEKKPNKKNLLRKKCTTGDFFFCFKRDKVFSSLRLKIYLNLKGTYRLRRWNHPRCFCNWRSLY